MFSGLVFLVVLGVLVVVHEWGHFVVARLVGIRVEKFSIGFGPVVFAKRFGETEFCVSLLPLGGFVKLAGENPNESRGEAWEFNSKSLLQKFMVVFAGPFMNAALAFLLFSFIFLFGQPMPVAKIGRVLDGTPAKTAGLAADDRILEVNRTPVSRWDEVLVEVHKGKNPTVFSVDRGGLPLEIRVIPQTGQGRAPFVGIAPSSEVIYLKSGFWESFRLGADRVAKLTGMIFLSLWLMVTGAMPFKDAVTGPIGIFFMTQQAAQMGILYLLDFTASLSVSLFVLNLLPIPVLDGGHVLFIVIERLKGSPLKESVKERMTQAGLTALLVLMAFVIFQDIHRFSVLENIMNLARRK
ncbi:MAG: RIP metalloprotease RseP [Candidatus Omnitrophica bacterium]|nr:RIP metalloprotease RseP [Candidatus Omnitrophota bacterium]